MLETPRRTRVRGKDRRPTDVEEKTSWLTSCAKLAHFEIRQKFQDWLLKNLHTEVNFDGCAAISGRDFSMYSEELNAKVLNFDYSEFSKFGNELWNPQELGTVFTALHIFALKCDVRGRSKKYLASPPEGATIARDIYYRVVHSRKRLLSKCQSNRTRSFDLTACGNGRVRGFYKNGKRAI